VRERLKGAANEVDPKLRSYRTWAGLQESIWAERHPWAKRRWLPLSSEELEDG
jgi:hypothetical protein